MSEQSQNQENFSNENIAIIVTKQPGCAVSLDVKVSPIATESCYHKAVKNVRKEVSIPGFRRGKVPESMILTKYANAIQEEFVDCTIQTAWTDSINLCHLEPLKNSVKRPVVHKCSREDGAHITFNYETRIVTPSIDFTSLSLNLVSPAEITEEQKKNAQENFLMQFVTYTPIENRAIQEGDTVDIDVVLQTNPPRAIAENQRIRVDKQNMPFWLCQKIIGLHAGDSIEGFSEKNDDDLSENFEPVPYTATVHALFTAHIPELNEELAHKVQAPSVEAILSGIDKQLQRQSAEIAERQNFNTLNSFLIEHYPFDIPNSLVEEEIHERIKRFKQDFPQHTQEELNEYTDYIKQIAANNIRIFFLFRKLIHDQNIQVTELDIQEEFYNQISKKSATGVCEIDFQDKEKIESQIRELALSKKARRFLLENART